MSRVANCAVRIMEQHSGPLSIYEIHARMKEQMRNVPKVGVLARKLGGCDDIRRVGYGQPSMWVLKPSRS